MARSKELTKEERIKKEYSRLDKVFKDLDKNKKTVVERLIKTAAFISVSLEDLQEIINEEGFSEEYQHGASQSGVKQSASVATHIAMTKNLTTIMKQLTELVPAAKQSKSKLAMLRDE